MVESTAANGHTPHDGRIMAALPVAGFALWVFGELRQANDPKWEDTEGYMAHSLCIADHGGVLGCLKQSFAGAFPVVERYLLYMLMLASFGSLAAMQPLPACWVSYRDPGTRSRFIVYEAESGSDSRRPMVAPSIGQQARLMSGNLHR